MEEAELEGDKEREKGGGRTGRTSGASAIHGGLAGTGPAWQGVCRLASLAMPTCVLGNGRVVGWLGCHWSGCLRLVGRSVRWLVDGWFVAGPAAGWLVTG